MPALKRRPEGEELQKLIELYLQAETDIINEIGRLRSLGLADYHVEAALARVQEILRGLENECWTYAPRMIEGQFYVHHPEARKDVFPPESVEKHRRAYENAGALSGEQMDMVQRLTVNLLGKLTEANVMAMARLEDILLGRQESDLFRRVGLEQTAAMQAAGRGAYRALPGFVEALRREGVTAFVDRAGRKWSLHTYGSMVLRTTSRQAEVLSVLTESPEQDLYQISRHGTTCKLCAPFEGRVYSKSGQSREFPPLSAAFGKVDQAGPDSLANSWLNIHPNCLHMLIPWTPAGRTEEEIQQIKDFSDPRKNPFHRDPRTREQIEAYRKKEAARAKWLRDYRQWERYRETLGDRAPKRFETFLSHKRAGDEKYKMWQIDYRRQSELLRYPGRALPGAINATAEERKFTEYLFGGNNHEGLAKGRAFSSRLGYNKRNWQQMRQEILRAATRNPAVYRDTIEFGDRYYQDVILYGTKGTPGNVRLAWLAEKDGTVHLTTAHMEEI